MRPTSISAILMAIANANQPHRKRRS